MAKTERPTHAEIQEGAMGHVLRALREFRDEYPEKEVFAAVFHEFHWDGEYIYWPMVAVGTQEDRVCCEEHESGGGNCWDSTSWEFLVEAAEAEQELADRMHEYGLSLCNKDAYIEEYSRFVNVFPLAAKEATELAIQEGLVGDEFIVVPLDGEMALVQAALSPDQLQRHFPNLVAEDAERQRIMELPQPERIAALVELLEYRPGRLLWGEAVVELLRKEGAAAVPQLLAVLQGKVGGEAWRVASLLADIHHSTPDVVAALEAVMLNKRRSGPDRQWCAAALARLGHSDVIVANLERLPDQVVARLAAPYGSFADQTADRNLDYRPLEQILDDYPQLEPLLAAALRSGAPVELREHELAEAKRATTSAHLAVREHATGLLQDYHATVEMFQPRDGDK